MCIRKEIDTITFNKQNFTSSTEGLISTKYEIIKKLGKGSYGRVLQVKNKRTGEIRACKQLSKNKISNLKKFQKEISILKKVDHPNIIKLYEVFEDDKYIYLIMEQCKGGELFDKIINHIQKKQMYTEKEAAIIFHQMISTISYLHNNNISHRDLKPENILYYNSGEEENNPIKLIDFGLSTFYDKILENEKMKSKVGTAYYVAPEVLGGNYNEKCDIWSAGVILYILLSGEPPFNGPNDNVIYQKIKKMEFNFPNEKWNNISIEAIDLIRKCICPEEFRLSAKEVLNHPWFKIIDNNYFPFNYNFGNLFKFSKFDIFKKMILNYIAFNLNEEDVKDLKNVFYFFDCDNDGSINRNDLREGFKKLNYDICEENIDCLFNSIDTDNNGFIDFTEFLAASIDEKLYLDDKKLIEAYLFFDKKNTGKITKNDIQNSLKIDENKIDKLFVEIDKNRNEKISYYEFFDLMGYNSYIFPC